MPLFCDPSKNKMFVTQEEAAKLCKAFNYFYNHLGLLILNERVAEGDTSDPPDFKLCIQLCNFAN